MVMNLGINLVKMGKHLWRKSENSTETIKERLNNEKLIGRQ